MFRHILLFASLILSGPCFADTDTPYWQDPDWQKSLFAAVQSAVYHVPDTQGVLIPNAECIMQFTYTAGQMSDAKMLLSTGSDELDAAMLRQAMDAQLPKVSGTSAAIPHQFQMKLEAHTPYEALYDSIRDTLSERRTLYPHFVFQGAGGEGLVRLQFSYRDGKADNVIVTHSSGDRTLDKEASFTVAHAHFSPPPAIYTGKSFHFNVNLCFTFSPRFTCNNAVGDLEAELVPELVLTPAPSKP